MGNARAVNRRYAGVCGEYCVTCKPAGEETCRGCAYQLGRGAGGDCALFQCAIVERGIEHCGLCFDFPCSIFRSHAAPAVVERRIRSLRRRAEVGTDRWLEEQETARRSDRGEG